MVYISWRCPWVKPINFTMRIEKFSFWLFNNILWRDSILLVTLCPICSSHQRQQGFFDDDDVKCCRPWICQKYSSKLVSLLFFIGSMFVMQNKEITVDHWVQNRGVRASHTFTYHSCFVYFRFCNRYIYIRWFVVRRYIESFLLFKKNRRAHLDPNTLSFFGRWGW